MSPRIHPYVTFGEKPFGWDFKKPRQPFLGQKAALNVAGRWKECDSVAMEKTCRNLLSDVGILFFPDHYDTWGKTSF